MTPDVVALYERMMRRRVVAEGGVSKRIDTGHGRLHLLDIPGTGHLPPVILLHGLSTSAATQFYEVIRHLRPFVSRIIAPDLLGHGESHKPKNGLGTNNMLGSLRTALDAVLDERAFLFGSSMGGAVAVRYAAQDQAKLLGLMLCSPGGSPMSAERFTEFMQQFRIKNHAQALEFVDRMFGKRRRLRRLYAFGVQRQFNRKSVVAILDSAHDGELLRPDELQSLRLPTQFWWGGREQLLPAEVKEFFVEHLPDHVDLQFPEKYGHTPFLDRPHDVVHRMVSFMRGQARGPLDSGSGETRRAG